MITVQDLNKKNLELDSITESNLRTTCERINKVETLWVEKGGAPFIATSGLRTLGQQENLIKAGKTKATKSKHMIGAAVDISDPGNEIKKWLKENPKILIEAHLWCEAAEYTDGWCHFQIIPPGSGNRWFIP